MKRKQKKIRTQATSSEKISAIHIANTALISEYIKRIYFALE